MNEWRKSNERGEQELWDLLLLRCMVQMLQQATSVSPTIQMIGSPSARCTSSLFTTLNPPTVSAAQKQYIFTFIATNRVSISRIFSLKSSYLQPTTKCKRSPNYSTQTTCNEPPRCHLPSLPLYRIRNSVCPSPSFIFSASTSRSPCHPVAPASRRIMLTAPLLRAGADMLAVRLRPLEQRVQQARGKGEVGGCCWTQAVWRSWAVTSRG